MKNLEWSADKCLKLGGTAEMIRPKHIFWDVFGVFLCLAVLREKQADDMAKEDLQFTAKEIERRKMEENNED